MRKLLVASFSLANFCYLRVWSELLSLRPQDTFYRDHGPRPFQYAAAICGVTLLGPLIFFGSVLLRKAPGWVKSIWFIALALVAANGVRSLLSPYFPVLRSGLFHLVSPQAALWLAIAAAICCCYLILRFSERIGRVAAIVATVFAPFLFITFGESALQIVRHNPDDPPDEYAGPRVATHSETRVLWVIFDELDYRLAFPSRPASISLPNLDRLCAQSLCASNAFPPADSTVISMPALIYGRMLKSTRPMSANRLRMEFPDGGTLRFGKPPNVFSRARAAGFNTAVVGWYLPYCRTLTDSLTDCWWSPIENQEGWMGDTFTEAFVRQPRSLLESSVFSPFGQSLVSHAHASVFSESLDHAKKMGADSQLGLVLIHFNIPHPPYFYNQRTGKFDRVNSLGGYADTLALVDHAFGELQAAIEKSGAWNHTAVLISADHWFRASPGMNGSRDHRVPFLLHLSQDDNAVAYSGKFGTVLTADLILKILNGEVKTNRQAADWITQQASRSVSAEVQPSTP